MSTIARFLRPYPHVLGHFARTRGLEVGVLQASPLLGVWLAGLPLEIDDLGRGVLLLAGSVALTAHVFVLNDWAGYGTDAGDPRRASLDSGGNDIPRNRIAHVALALLLVAGGVLASVGTSALLLGGAIAALGLTYSLAPRLGKSTPVAASLNHLIGGALHFLMGYTLFTAADLEGIVLSLFFGLVFAAGHLNQEIRDHESDRENGIRTTAVAFGCRRSFLASFCLFTAAHGLLVGLAAAEVLPRIVLATAVVWSLQAWWSLVALRRGLQAETAVWIQRRYRLLFALVGLLLIVR